MHVYMNKTGPVKQIRMKVQPDQLNGGGMLHGGALASLLDLACAYITWEEPLMNLLLTINLNVQYEGKTLPGEWVEVTGDVTSEVSYFFGISCSCLLELYLLLLKSFKLTHLNITQC